MALAASAQMGQLVTRHILFVECAGRLGLPPLSTSDVAVTNGAIAMACAGSEMTATVILERHDGPPPPSGDPWRVRHEGPWSLISGRLGVANLEGLIEWLPDVGLIAGSWQLRVSSAGSQEAQELEDAMYEDADVTDVVEGPERWLIQVWR